MNAIAPRRPLSEQPVLNLGQACNPNSRRLGEIPAPDGSGKGGGKSHGDLDQEHGDWRDRQPMTVGCICGEFTAEGPAAEARAEFQAHLEEAHSERVGKGPRRNRRAFEKAEQIEAARPAVEQRAAAAVASEQREENQMDEDHAPPPAPVTDYPCKRQGCKNRARRNRGPTAYLCDEHATRKKPAVVASKPKPEPAATSNGHKPTSPVELAREIVLLSEDVTNLEAELIGKYARLGELGQQLAQIGTSR